MKTEIVTITELNNDAKEKLREAASILSSGGLVVMPTETVYGLGGDATSDDAAKKIYEDSQDREEINGGDHTVDMGE